MADDKASDLDVFEGLTKKKDTSSHAPPGPASSDDGGGVPAAPPTMRGGTAAPSARVLPPPKRPSESALPKPSAPPSKRPSGSIPSSRSSALPKPKPPPSKRPSSSPPGARESDAPVVSIKPATGMRAVFDEPSGSILPGSAVADLDWDDEEEATNVFDRSASDLFGDLAGKPRSVSAPSQPMSKPSPSLGNAAALLASSGRSAQSLAAPSVPLPGATSLGGMSGAPMSMPHSGFSGPVTIPSMSQQPMMSDAMPKIPAPAPVPRDISQSDAGSSDMPAARPPHPSWAPAAPAPPMAPPTQRSSASTVLLALVAVAVLGAAAFFYLRSSSAAAVVIAVTHEGTAVDQANIYVDGQKKCEFAPCKLDMKPGTKVIRVVSGNLAGSKTINVEGGKDLQVAIALGLTDEVAPPTSDSAEPSDDKPASLALASAMKDVDIGVSVNGEDNTIVHEGKLPVDLSDLKPGSYRLVFSGGDKYGNLEKTVELKSGDTLKLDDIKLPLAKVEVTFSLATRGAKVVLVEKDGDKEKESALAFRGNKAEQTLDTKKTWLVKASLKGYEDFEKQLEFPEDEDKMALDIELAKESDKPAPVAVTEPQPNTKGPAPQPPPASDSGFINANSIPPSKVIINGVPKGSTPVTGVKVAPGSHTVVFKHAELGTEARTVTVAPGQTKTATVRFKAKEQPASGDGAGDGSGDGGGKKKKKKKKSDG